MATNNSANLAVTQGMNAAITGGNYTLSNLRNGARYVVSATSGQGGYTTIQSAINQAVSDGANASNPATILIWPTLSYAESIVLKDYVNLCSIAGNVSVTGNATYPAGSGTVNLNRISFTSSNSSPALFLSAGVVVTAYGCSVSGTSSGPAVKQTASSEFVGYNCSINCEATSHNLDIDDSIFIAISSFFSNSGSASLISGSSEIFIRYSSLNDYYVVSEEALLLLDDCSVGSSHVIADLDTNTSVTFNECVVECNDGGGYFVTGGGAFFFCGLSLIGSAVLMAPALGGTGFPTLVGSLVSDAGISTSPAASQTSSLTIASAYQSPFAYDVILTVYIAITSSVTASILCGVGPTNTPTQQTVVSNVSLAALSIIPISVYLPKSYYVLISTTGTITQTISGQQATPV